MTASFEEKSSAANYILNFYDNVQKINHFYAIYGNFLLLTKFQHGEDAKAIKDRMTDQDKATFANNTENLHYYIDQAMLSAKIFAKVKGIKVDQDKESAFAKVTDSHKIISAEYTIKKEELDKFVEAINIFVVDNIMPSLLQTSQDIVNRLNNRG